MALLSNCLVLRFFLVLQTGLATKILNFFRHLILSRGNVCTVNYECCPVITWSRRHWVILWLKWIPCTKTFVRKNDIVLLMVKAQMASHFPRIFYKEQSFLFLMEGQTFFCFVWFWIEIWTVLAGARHLLVKVKSNRLLLNQRILSQNSFDY